MKAITKQALEVIEYIKRYVLLAHPSKLQANIFPAEAARFDFQVKTLSGECCLLTLDKPIPAPDRPIYLRLE